MHTIWTVSFLIRLALRPWLTISTFSLPKALWCSITKNALNNRSTLPVNYPKACTCIKLWSIPAICQHIRCLSVVSAFSTNNPWSSSKQLWWSDSPVLKSGFVSLTHGCDLHQLYRLPWGWQWGVAQPPRNRSLCLRAMWSTMRLCLTETKDSSFSMLKVSVT